MGVKEAKIKIKESQYFVSFSFGCLWHVYFICVNIYYSFSQHEGSIIEKDEWIQQLMIKDNNHNYKEIIMYTRQHVGYNSR